MGGDCSTPATLPSLTICIPCYNERGYLTECLQSILSQSFRDFEILIVDDASDQDYPETLRQFNDGRIKYMRNDTNIGAMKNILKAIEYASESRYCMAFHEDDLMGPGLLEWEVSILESDEEILFVGTEMLFFDSHVDLPAQAALTDPQYEVYDHVSEFARRLMQGAPLNFGSVMYRNSARKQVHADYSRYNTLCDRPFLCTLAKRGKCAFIREPLVYYRTHGPKDLRGENLTEANLIELFRFYRSCLPSDFNKDDMALFYRYSTNNLLDSYVRLKKGHRSSLPRFVRKCVRSGVFHPLFIDKRGISALKRWAIRNCS